MTLQENLNESAGKEVHELMQAEFLPMHVFLAHRSRVDRFLTSGLTEIPESVREEIDTVTFPLNSKMWYDSLSGIDKSVLILKEFSVDTFQIRSQKYPESQEHLLGRNITIDRYAELIQSGVSFPPLLGYQHNSDVYLLDGNRRYLAAKKAGVPSLQIWVEEIDESGLTVNRAEYVRRALEAGKTVPEEVLSEVQSATYKEGREFRTLFRHTEKRRNEYPSVGDQLDAIHKYLRGQKAPLEDIWNWIDEVKNKYTKTP